MTRGLLIERYSYGRLVFMSFFSFLFVINFGSLYLKNQPARTVYIKIAFGPEFKIKDKMEIRSLIRDCSHLFKNNFNIQFKVKKNEDWKFAKDQNSMRELLSDLRKKVLPGKCDIVIGIVPQKNINDADLGIFSYFHGYAVIKYVKSKRIIKLALLHELSHIFGAVDLKAAGSIMNYQNPEFKFDDFTSKIILLNWHRSFHSDSFPLSGSQLTKAISFFRERAKICLGESEMHRMLALLYLEKQKYSLAEKECFETIKLSPDNKEIHNILGGIYLKQGKIDLAIEEYQKLSVHFPKSPEIHFNVGLAYLNKGIIDRAESKFKQAIELNPSFAIAHALLGRLYFRQRKIEEAIIECRRALEYYPENAELLCIFAAALVFRCDDIKRDTLRIEKSRANLKSSYDCSRDAKILEVEELLKEAEAKCLKAIEISPELAEANNVLGITYTYQGDNEKAETEFLKALELNPNFVQAHHNLGVLYFNNNLLEKAAFHLKQIIDINFSSGLGYQILEKTFKHPTKYYISIDAFK